jgi:hypothetical protein
MCDDTGSPALLGAGRRLYPVGLERLAFHGRTGLAHVSAEVAGLLRRERARKGVGTGPSIGLFMRSVLAFLAWLILTPVVFLAADVAAQSPAWGFVATSIWWVGGALAGTLLQDRVDSGHVSGPAFGDDKRPG